MRSDYSIGTSAGQAGGIAEKLEKEPVMSQIEKVLYTAKTHTTGGRDGASRTSDGCGWAGQLGLHAIDGGGAGREAQQTDRPDGSAGK